jgi:hypothetical protein
MHDKDITKAAGGLVDLNEKKKMEPVEPEECKSISEDKYFWNELHIIVEDGVNSSKEE